MLVMGSQDSGDNDPWRAQLGALGSFIRAQRRIADMSLRDMATMTHVSNAYLSQVERGLHQPSVKVLQSIASALGVPFESLLHQAGVPPEPPAESAAAAGDTATEDAIRADPRLSDAQRAALIGVYRSFLGPQES